MADNKHIVEQIAKAFAAGDLDGMFASYADDCVIWEPAEGETRGIESNKALVAGYKRAFPDAHFDVQAMHEDGPVVFVRGAYVGTHTGPLETPQGEIPATGKSVRVEFADVFEFRGGKIVREETYYDQLSFMQQLGLMPEEG